LAPVAIVRAGSTRRRGGRALKARAPDGAVTIGIGRDYVSGVDVDVVIPADPEGSAGAIITGQTTAFDAGTADLAGAADQGPLVYAPKAGRFATNRRIGDLVRRRDVVGAIGDVDVVAPISGALRGLSSRGAAVFEGAIIVEVDPRGDPALCFGVDERAGRIAQRVVCALEQHLRSAMAEPESGIAANAAQTA
jgi:xanthine dehydrogenase accessory factor